MISALTTNSPRWRRPSNPQWSNSTRRSWSGETGQPARQVARETGAAYGGVLYVDSLTPADGAVPSYLDLLRVTTDTIARGLGGETS